MGFGAHCPSPVRLGGSLTEGITAGQHARLCADVAAIKRVAPLAAWTFTQDSSSPYGITIVSYFGMNGAGSLYAPTATVNSQGDVNFQWSSGYFEDEYEQQHAFKIRHMLGSSHNNSSVDAAWVNVAAIARGVNVRWERGTLGTGKVSVRVW
jgi:hypothetical protein